MQLRRALEAQDAEESWTDEERRALSAHIEEGYQQAERGELIDGEQARREIQAMKRSGTKRGCPNDERLCSLIPQRNHRIHFRRPARRDHRSQQCNRQKEARNTQ